MPTPNAIHTLVDCFRSNLDSYKRGTFGNETQVRREFVDPMFEALRWDASRHRTSRPRCNATPKADATDKQIDALVYKLYDLMFDEIRIVEANRQPGLQPLKPEIHPQPAWFHPFQACGGIMLPIVGYPLRGYMAPL